MALDTLRITRGFGLHLRKSVKLSERPSPQRSLSHNASQPPLRQTGTVVQRVWRGLKKARLISGDWGYAAWRKSAPSKDGVDRRSRRNEQHDGWPVACTEKTVVRWEDSGDWKQRAIEMQERHRGAIEMQRPVNGQALRNVALSHRQDPRVVAGEMPLEPCGFRPFFDHNLEGPGIHKWLHSFAVYEREFGRWCDAARSPKFRMLEIGIQSGGSMKMWLTAFGKRLELLVGVDVDPATRTWQSLASNVRVEISSQADAQLWARLENKFGGFDIILDDGSHIEEDIVKTYVEGFRLVRPGGVYVIEDITQENAEAVRRIFWSPERTMGLMNKMHSHAEGERQCCNITANWVQTHVEYLAVYPNMVAIRKRMNPLSRHLVTQRRGSQWTPNAGLFGDGSRAAPTPVAYGVAPK